MEQMRAAPWPDYHHPSVADLRRGLRQYVRAGQISNIVSRMRAGKRWSCWARALRPGLYFTPDLARGLYRLCASKSLYYHFHIHQFGIDAWGGLYRTIAAHRLRAEVCLSASEVLKEADFGLFAHFYYEKKYASVFSNEKIFAAAPAYRPQITLRDGMEQILAWWESQGMPVDPRKDAMEDQLCSAYARFKNDVCQALKQ